MTKREPCKGREIKFRAWDTCQDRFWWNVQTAYDALGNHSDPNPNVKGDAFYEDCFGCVLASNDYIVEQFTGVRDKNGVEIYEGDIVETADDGKAVVAFQDGRFGVEVRREGYSGESAEEGYEEFVPLSDEVLSVGFSDGGIPELIYVLEVVGNIHQNGGLLS